MSPQVILKLKLKNFTVRLLIILFVQKAKVSSMFVGTKDKCLACTKTVYPTEKVICFYSIFSDMQSYSVHFIYSIHWIECHQYCRCVSIDKKYYRTLKSNEQCINKDQ